MGFASLPARIRSPQILKISRLIGSKKSSAATRSLIAAKADLERVSTRDFQRYDDNGVNWRVIDGYGAVIAAHGEGLPVVFGSPARHIDHSGRRLRVDIRTGRSLPMPPSSRYRARSLRTRDSFTPPLPSRAPRLSACCRADNGRRFGSRWASRKIRGSTPGKAKRPGRLHRHGDVNAVCLIRGHPRLDRQVDL
jgi:hypothetical protein